MPEASPSRRRVAGGIVVALFSVLLGLRAWLHTKEVNEREAQLRAIGAASDRINREMSEKMVARGREEAEASLRRDVEKLEAMGRDIHVPPPLVLDTKPDPHAKSGPPAPEPRLSARDKPAELVIANADLAAGWASQASAAEYRDRGLRKPTVAALEKLRADLQALVGKDGRFADDKAASALLPRVAELRTLAAGAMKPGLRHDKVLASLDDLEADLRDLRPAEGPADGGPSGR